MGVRHTRRIAVTQGDYGDYIYDKKFANGRAGRRGLANARRALSKRMRAVEKRAVRTEVADES